MNNPGLMKNSEKLMEKSFSFGYNNIWKEGFYD